MNSLRPLGRDEAGDHHCHPLDLTSLSAARPEDSDRGCGPAEFTPTTPRRAQKKPTVPSSMVRLRGPSA